ncbi:protein of unknown function DUF87 [Desulfofundulus kuznetsovii DSM 6115]|uniref:Helicase HerA central domain-containing protein n=1 Tax=Desulfofundulus kuznetsovii (strain DSM 6115 / VKM B-1805 / 17) TaxID=760568 RepID=A0AAU8P8R2_DESK7|nr:protein of unknown function DUF87 [Desulfofundulus kuznetsovii DSM 6115]
MVPDLGVKNVREVGRVISVFNYRVKVLLDPDVRSQIWSYPHRVSIVTQIGGYLLFPVAPGESAVGIVIGASENETIEADTERDMTLQLARSRRILTINLLGQLRESMPFEPGVSIYPVLETPALLPSEEELKAILEYQPRDNRDIALVVGQSPIYRQDVTVSFNDLLARPFGVIGNTGSGKSWSVASIIQSALALLNKQEQPVVEQLNWEFKPLPKFIILDINGEYGSAFPFKNTDSEAISDRELNKSYINGKPFELPLWIFNLAELISFFEASQASQVPILERVITMIREDSIDPSAVKPFRQLVRLIDKCLNYLGSLSVYAGEANGRAVSDNTAELISHLQEIICIIRQVAKDKVELPSQFNEIEEDIAKIRERGLRTKEEYEELRKERNWAEFNRLPPGVAEGVMQFVAKLEPVIQQFRLDIVTKGGLKQIIADSPIQFNPRELERDAHFHIAASRHGAESRIQEFISTLRLRIHRQLADKRWSVFTQGGGSLKDILWAMTGQDDDQVIVVDCSMLAHDVLPFFCAVFGRILLEVRTQAEPAQRTVQPYVIVLEEAHNYLKPRNQGEAPGLTLARETFERIAKEGRKFGLSLVIASQRPSDVSATVLSQCANFLVHRIQNPEDIEYFKKILPVGSRDLLEQLPILAPGEGLLLGSAVNVAARVKVRKPEPVPTSDTPRPWEAWQPGKEQFNIGEFLKTWIHESDGEPEDGSKDTAFEETEVVPQNDFDDEVP